MQAKRAQGFTLVEVLVALAVIAIALTAVMQNFGQGIETTIALRDRTIAMWVAQNQLAGHYLPPRTWPSTDTTEGTAELAGRTWHWRQQVMTTPEKEVRRIEIDVRAAPNRESLAHLVGFLPNPTKVAASAGSIPSPTIPGRGDGR